MMIKIIFPNNIIMSLITNMIRLLLKIEKIFLLYCYLFLGGCSLCAQDSYVKTHNDSLALENVIVEKYYIADSIDTVDTTGGYIPKGSVTYRIYIDMKPGYSLQVVYGDKKHELSIKTTTKFFNNKESCALTGFNIDPRIINKNSVALDSWLTMGAATRIHSGVLKSEDKDSSIIHRSGLTNTDGLTKGNLPLFKVYNLDLNFFNSENAVDFFLDDGGWAAMGGVKGPTDENRVLIAQLTTDGKITFKFNIQIGTPSGGFIQFVPNDPVGPEIKFAALTNY
jgi:hypothetical protein